MAKKKQRINLIDRDGNSQVVEVNSTVADNKSDKKKSIGSTIKNTVSGIVKGGNTKAISDERNYGPLTTVARTVTGGVSSAKDKQGHNLIDNTKQAGKNLVSGAFSGATSIPDSELYEVRNSLEKGEKKAEETNGVRDTLKSLFGTGKDALLSSNPITAQFVKDDDDSKGVEGALKGLKDVSDISGGKKGLYKSIEAFGEAYSDYKKAKGEEGKLSKKVEKLQEKIDKPAEEYAQKVQEENQNYSKPVQVLGENFQTVGNMVPSMAMSIATKNPSAGMWALYQGAKGSATKEALQKGADLDTATAVGNAKGLIEFGTEQLSSGIKFKGKSVYGKGALDDVIENNVNRFVKNKAANWLVKQFGTAPLGEIAEETISDLAGHFIDKNTVDPNDKYTLKDWAHTVGMTYLSTLTINLLGGSYGKSSYNQNLQSMAETQVADIQNRVDRGLMSQEDGARAIEQITKELNDSIGTNEEISTPEEIQEALANTSPEDIQQAVASATNAVANQVQQGKLNEQQGQRLLETIQENAQVLLEQQQQLTQNQNGQMQFNLDNQSTIEDKISLVQSLNDTEYNALSEITQKLKRGEQLNEQDRATLNYLNSKQNQNVQENVQQEVVQEQPKLPTDTNDKVQNYRNSLENENIEDRDGFFKAFEKIIQDKDYNVVFDSSITNEQGNPVNAVISNENGITIRINPQSERASEILLMHEVTHGIETKEMRNLIMDYAKKDTEFNDALEDLKKVYGTEDVTPEVVADISGQLFGNQEFINNLAVEKPSLFKKILDAIKELANRLTGNKVYNKFVKSLQVKWERAYRNANIESSQQNLKEGAKYSQNAEITDNKGRPLNINMQNYMENSQATDDKGRLVTLYHTTTDMIKQFNEFDPANKYDPSEYKFGKYNVTYLTDGEEMSESYSMYEPRKADTRRLNNIKEAEEYLENTSLRLVDIENTNQAIKNHFKDNKNRYFLVSGDLTTFGEYKTEDELLRDVIPTAQQVMRGNSNFKYEVYANITKPYIIDAEGNNWDKVAREINEESKKVVDSLSKEQKEELSNYAKESLDKWQKWHMSDDYLEYKKYDDVYKNLNSEEQENLIIMSMKDNFTPQDYVDAYNEYGKEFNMKSPDSKIELNPYGEVKMERSYKDFVAEWCRLEAEAAKYENQYSYFLYKAMKNYSQQLRSVDANKMFDMAKYDFKDWAVEDTLSTDLKTNDVVRKVIEMNENGEDYDGVIIKNTTDYGIRGGDEPHDVYVVFNSNQIKAVDNPDPTNDPDIRYSEKAEKWQEYLEKNFKNKGTTTKAKDYIRKVPKQMDTKDSSFSNENALANRDNNAIDKQGNPVMAPFLQNNGGNGGNGGGNNNTTALGKQPEPKKGSVEADILRSYDERIANKKKPFKEKIDTVMHETTRALFDKGEEIYRIGKGHNDAELYPLYDLAQTSKASADFSINADQTNLNGEKVGESLNKVWEEVEKKNLVYEMNKYLYEQHNLDRWNQFNEDGSRKYVFGPEHSDIVSKKNIADLLRLHPELEELSKPILQYQKNLKQLLVDSGLQSQSQSDKLDSIYKNYVPTWRDKDNTGIKAMSNYGGNVTVNNQIKAAKGSSENLLPLKEVQAQMTENIFKAARMNVFLQQLYKDIGDINELKKIGMNSLKSDTNIEPIDADAFYKAAEEHLDEYLKNYAPNNAKVDKVNGQPVATVWFNGHKVTMPIDKGIQTALEPVTVDGNVAKILETINNFKRGVITEYNPIFAITNAKKDIDDAIINSKFSAVEYQAEYAKSIKEMLSNKKMSKEEQTLFNQYLAMGGYSNTVFDKRTGFAKEPKAGGKVLAKIGDMNDFIEQIPRFTEFKLTLKHGGSLTEAMYNAAEVTTNFKRSGVLTKKMDKLATTFFSASMAGFYKQVRNLTQQPSGRAYARFAAKSLAIGLTPAIINGLMYANPFGDDDDKDEAAEAYKNLPQYVKDDYLVWYIGDGKFMRIPKGRVASIPGIVYNAAKNKVQNEEVSFGEMVNSVLNQVGPSNPLSSNAILQIWQSGLFDNKSQGTSWNGSKIESSYLHKKEVTERYDSKTDEISKAISKGVSKATGGKIKISPKKLNYTIDQNSGIIGDILLPIFTPKSTGPSTAARILNPITSKFTTDTVVSNKTSNKFYDKIDKYNEKADAETATRADLVKKSYLSSVSGEIADKRKQIEEIESSDLSKNEKYKQTRELQKEINNLQKKALEDENTYKKVGKGVSTIGDEVYYKSSYDGRTTWKKESDKTKEKRDELGLSVEKYYYYKKDEAFKKPDGKTTSIVDGKTAKDKIALVDAFGFDPSDYEKYSYEINQIKAGKDTQRQVTEYIEGLPISATQKAALYKKKYKSYRNADRTIYNSIENSNLSKEEKESLAKFLKIK